MAAICACDMLRIWVVMSAEIFQEIKPLTCVVDKALTCAVVNPGAKITGIFAIRFFVC